MCIYLLGLQDNNNSANGMLELKNSEAGSELPNSIFGLNFFSYLFCSLHGSSEGKPLKSCSPPKFLDSIKK